MDVGAVTRIQCRIDTARRVVVIPAVEGGADVAVAVIDRSIGVPDTTVTIASRLLMQSDLRGHVEDAAWYLRTPRREAGPAADALMLTRGWTRYDMPAAISRRNQRLTPIPLGNRLHSSTGNPLEMARKAPDRCHSKSARSTNGRRAVALTDSLGHFCITGLRWPDSTFLVISATNRKVNLKKISIPNSTFPSYLNILRPELGNFREYIIIRPVR